MSIKLNRNKILSAILIFILIVNLLVLFKIQYFYSQAIFSFAFLITVPGLLILLIFKIKNINIWEYLVYTVGLSIAFLLFGGLIINWVLPLVGIGKPLLPIPLLISFSIFLLIFWMIAYRRNKETIFEIVVPKLSLLNKIFFIIPIIFPILSIMGATTLNNQGPNYPTLIMLGGIAVYVLLIVGFRYKLNENIYPWAILMISISLLLMYSLRSWHIMGYDIHQEYQVFQLTREKYQWSMSNFPLSPYNACLSLTLLPTVFSSFLNINDEYIFKLVFQIVFSFIPVIVFLFLRRYAKNVTAFLAVFFFVSQPSFAQQITALMRQEIAYLFFALFLMALFDKNFNFSIKNTFLLIFGFSMIISHYSTSYIAIILFIFVYFIWLLFRKTENKRVFSNIYQKLNLKEKGKFKRENHFLCGNIVLILIVFSFLWSFVLTGSSDNLTNLVKLASSNLGKIFSDEMKSNKAQLALGGSEEAYNIEDLRNYRDNATKEYQTWIDFYSPEEYADYSIEPRYPRSILAVNSMIKSIVDYLNFILHRLLVIFILIGVFYLIFFQFKKREIDGEYIIMSLGCIFLLGLIILVPYVSLAYNVERLFQQALFILSLPAVTGVLLLFQFLKNKSARFFVTTVIFILVFLPYYGFTSQFVGGEPQRNLNNFGEDFDMFYTHEAEVKSLGWLSKYYNMENVIYMDQWTIIKSYSFSKINRKSYLEDILPSTIDRNSYVYSGYTNTIEKRTLHYYELKVMAYNFPTEFLNNNKNKIYNNGSSEIFK